MCRFSLFDMTSMAFFGTASFMKSTVPGIHLQIFSLYTSFCRRSAFGSFQVGFVKKSMSSEICHAEVKWAGWVQLASTSNGRASLHTLRQAFRSLWLDVPDTDEGWTLSVWQARPPVHKFNRKQSFSMLVIDHGGDGEGMEASYIWSECK